MGEMPLSACLSCDHVDQDEVHCEQQLPRDKKPPHGDRRLPSGGGDAFATGPEKSRLQEFVKDFAKCAVRGTECEVIDEHTGQLVSCKYFVDAQLQKLSFRQVGQNNSPSPGGGQSPQSPQGGLMREYQLGCIQEVMDFDSAKPQLPPQVLHAVNQASHRERLIVMKFSDDKNSPAYLLEGSGVDRDRFVMCVKILRLYAQTHGAE